MLNVLGGDKLGNNLLVTVMSFVIKFNSFNKFYDFFPFRINDALNVHFNGAL